MDTTHIQLLQGKEKDYNNFNSNIILNDSLKNKIITWFRINTQVKNIPRNNYKNINKIMKLPKSVKTLINYARVSLLGTSVLYYMCRYAFLGDYDQRMIELIESLSRKSPIYVKIFQAISGSSGILSEKVQKYISIFSDNVPYMKSEQDFEKLQKYLEKIGDEYPDVKIIEITKEPIHSGTISLVYEGLLSNGEKVVIKHVRNGIKERMEKALHDAEYLINILNMIPSIKMLNLSCVLKENKKLLMEQTSMGVELKNMNDLLNNTKDTKRDYVKIPKPYDVYTENNDDVLVMEKICGRRINELHEDEKEQYGLMIARNTIDSMMIDGLYHGDLHRGNILFLEEQNVKRIGVIDFGIIGRLNECERLTISSFFLSLGMKNYEDVINSMMGLNSNKEIIKKMEKDKYDEMISELIDITEMACMSRDGFSSKEITKINNILVNNDLLLDPIFYIIEMSIAMSITVCKELDTKHKNFMSYLQEVIQEKIDISLFDV